MEPNKELIKLYNRYYSELGLSGASNAAILTLAHVISEVGKIVEDVAAAYVETQKATLEMLQK